MFYKIGNIIININAVSDVYYDKVKTVVFFSNSDPRSFYGEDAEKVWNLFNGLIVNPDVE